MQIERFTLIRVRMAQDSIETGAKNGGCSSKVFPQSERIPCIMTIYETNCHHLAIHHPELVPLLTQPIATTHLHVSYTSQGIARLLVQTKTGEEVALHDATDPLGVMEGTAQHMTQAHEGVTVLLGLELGYLAKALARRLTNKSALIICEPDPGIFLTALRETDLTEVLCSPKIKLLGENLGRLVDWCSHCMAQTGRPVRMVGSEAADQLSPSYYRAQVERDMSRCHTIALASQNALGRRGSQFVGSVLENIPHIILSPGIHELRGLTTDIPAILVAAGPSLEKNVHHLKWAKGRAVIISADTALGYLLAWNIVPDFVISADPQDTTYQKYEGVDIPKEVSLVFHPATNHHIVKHFPGKKFVFDCSIPVYQWLQRFWPSKGPLETETMCQVHIGFNLAEWLGCPHIILVGQDLSYSPEKMHVKGGSYLSESDMKVVARRSCSATNIFGQAVRTDPTFLNYKAIFEKKISSFSGVVLNATEGGLKIEGAELCRLTDALAERCPEKSVDFHDKMDRISHDVTTIQWDELVREVNARTRDCDRVERTARHVTRLLERIDQKRKASKIVDAELIRFGKQVEQLTGLIPQYSCVRKLLHWMDISLERQLSEDIRAQEHTLDIEARRDKECERGIRYYGGLERVAPILQEKMQRLAQRLEGLSQIICVGNERGALNVSDEAHETFMELELFDYAMQTLDCTLDKQHADSMNLQEIHTAIRLSLELHQIRLAKEQLQLVQPLYQDNPELGALISHVEAKWDRWQDKMRMATDSLPIAKESAITAGDFYHRVGNFARAKQFYNRAIEEEGLIPDDVWGGFKNFLVDRRKEPVSLSSSIHHM